MGVAGAAVRVQAWTFLGRCQVSMGEIRAGVASYERALTLDPADVDAWIHLAQARKEVRKPYTSLKAYCDLLCPTTHALQGWIAPCWQRGQPGVCIPRLLVQAPPQDALFVNDNRLGVWRLVPCGAVCVVLGRGMLSRIQRRRHVVCDGARRRGT